MSKNLDFLAKTGKQRQLQDSLESFIRQLPRGTHLTAPEVYKRASEAGLKVSLSTVYRTLNSLSEHGHVQALSGEHGRRYESLDPGHDHDHLICLKCGLTIEFEDDLIAGFGRTVAERKDYEYRNSRFDILGICQQCSSLNEEHKIDNTINQIEKLVGHTELISESLAETIEFFQARKISQGKGLLSSILLDLREICEELEKALSQNISASEDSESKE